jgi:hypothetical protein
MNRPVNASNPASASQAPFPEFIQNLQSCLKNVFHERADADQLGSDGRTALSHAVERDVQKWGYHLSAAHYLNGCQARGLPGDNFAWIFIEKKPPYAIGLYFASPDLLLRGKTDMRGYLDRYAECLAHDVWPAYSPDFQTIDLPAWAK